MTAGNASGDGASRIRLRTDPDASLDEDALGETVIAAAHAAAERTGVTLKSVVRETDGLVLEVEGPMLVAIGLAAELRRATDHWYRDRTGRHLWIAPEDESTP